MFVSENMFAEVFAFAADTMSLNKHTYDYD